MESYLNARPPLRENARLYFRGPKIESGCGSPDMASPLNLFDAVQRRMPVNRSSFQTVVNRPIQAYYGAFLILPIPAVRSKLKLGGDKKHV